MKQYRILSHPACDGYISEYGKPISNLYSDKESAQKDFPKFIRQWFLDNQAYLSFALYNMHHDLIRKYENYKLAGFGGSITFKMKFISTEMKKEIQKIKDEQNQSDTPSLEKIKTLEADLNANHTNLSDYAKLIINTEIAELQISIAKKSSKINKKQKELNKIEEALIPIFFLDKIGADTNSENWKIPGSITTEQAVTLSNMLWNDGPIMLSIETIE